jgi:hypothetical protein
MVGGISKHFDVALLIGTIIGLLLTHAAWACRQAKHRIDRIQRLRLWRRWRLWRWSGTRHASTATRLPRRRRNEVLFVPCPAQLHSILSRRPAARAVRAARRLIPNSNRA